MRLWSTAITTITYGVILIVIGLAASSCEIAGANCLPDTVGLPPPDPLQSSRAPFLGRAIGETFYSSDTLLTRITVWRPAVGSGKSDR